MIPRDVSVAKAMSEDVRIALPKMAIRDIAIRGVALGLGPQTLVSEVMSPNVRYCHAEDRLDKVLEGMGLLQVRRMPVLDRNERLIGIISLADAGMAPALKTTEALDAISEPGGENSQGDDGNASRSITPVHESDDESTGSNLLHFTDDDPT